MSVIRKTIPTIGAAIAGGFFAGPIQINTTVYGLIVSPRAAGDLDPALWISDYKDVPGALSLNDGLANTRAMAEAGSKLAQRILDLKIGGQTDWYLGAVDEYDVAYRSFKPTATANWPGNRSGINTSVTPPTGPYTAQSPAQTTIDLFRANGAEGFAPVLYWTSTQYAPGSYGAWYQNFSDGYQTYWDKDSRLRGRAFRRVPIDHLTIQSFKAAAIGTVEAA